MYAFVAGPYKEFKNASPVAGNYAPMRIFARKSIEKYVDAPEFFKLTMSGMDYYAKFFGTPYPFSKYDQVYVPEFNSGAMENVGCVTYNEAYIPRQKVCTKF